MKFGTVRKQKKEIVCDLSQNLGELVFKKIEAIP
jgi:hypothetical protein